MRDTFVIDGYNLIHALGMIRKNAPAGGLEASRCALLDFLAQSFGEDAGRVTVVFDAKHAPRGSARRREYRGLRVQFAPKGQSADDWIETLIANDSAPSALAVVSNDARLQHAARQRGARGWSDEMLLDFLEKRRSDEMKPTPAAEKRDETISPDEARRWLKEFESVESDPELKEFFDFDRFEE